MGFKEYSNPEEMDYDIKSSLNTTSSNSQSSQQYYMQLFDLIGILEDINEEELKETYGISMHEYFNPTAETIRKVSAKLNEVQKGRQR